MNTLKLAKEKGLADITLVPGRDDIEGRIRELTDGRGADTVFEVAGGKDTFQTAWKIARPNAVVVIVAMYEEAQTLPLPDMYGKNLIFKTGGVDGSYCQEIMDLTACGKLEDFSSLTAAGWIRSWKHMMCLNRKKIMLSNMLLLREQPLI